MVKEVEKEKNFMPYGKLRYEGDYLNGERNGKGKEYFYNNSSIFYDDTLEKNILYDEKEYCELLLECHINIRTSQKEVIENSNNNNKIKFEGEYLNGKICKGKEYDINGNLIFVGEYLNVIKYKGKQFYNGKEEYLNIRWNGKEFSFINSIIIEGEYFNGTKNKVKQYNTNGILIFEGEYLQNFIWKGKEYNYVTGELLFEGEFFSGKRHGKGKEYY